MKLASTSVTNNDTLANIRDTVRTKDSQIKAMAAQLKLLSDTVALLAKNAKPTDENRDPNSRGRSRGARGGQSRQMTKPRNMGAYCWAHGFHPVGVIHDSKIQERRSSQRCHVQQSLQRQHVFACRHARGHRPAESCDVEEHEQAHLTGTGDDRKERQFRHCLRL